MDAADVSRLLGLAPLPVEGGHFRRQFADAHSSAIYYLLSAGEFSAVHRLTATEVYHHYAGAPARLLLLEPGGGVSAPVLGSDLGAGQRPQAVVLAGTWQGSATLGAWSLLGATMAPPYRDEDFELGDLETLQAGWPAAADRIAALVR